MSNPSFSSHTGLHLYRWMDSISCHQSWVALWQHHRRVAHCSICLWMPIDPQEEITSHTYQLHGSPTGYLQQSQVYLTPPYLSHLEHESAEFMLIQNDWNWYISLLCSSFAETTANEEDELVHPEALHVLLDLLKNSSYVFQSLFLLSLSLSLTHTHTHIIRHRDQELQWQTLNDVEQLLTTNNGNMEILWYLWWTQTCCFLLLLMRNVCITSLTQATPMVRVVLYLLTSCGTKGKRQDSVSTL